MVGNAGVLCSLRRCCGPGLRAREILGAGRWDRCRRTRSSPGLVLTPLTCAEPSHWCGGQVGPLGVPVSLPAPRGARLLLGPEPRPGLLRHLFIFIRGLVCACVSVLTSPSLHPSLPILSLSLSSSVRQFLYGQSLPQAAGQPPLLNLPPGQIPWLATSRPGNRPLPPASHLSAWKAGGATGCVSSDRLRGLAKVPGGPVGIWELDGVSLRIYYPI